MLSLKIPKEYGSKFSRFILGYMINEVSIALNRSDYSLTDKALRTYLNLPSDSNITSYSLMYYYVRLLKLSETDEYYIISDSSVRENVVGTDKSLRSAMRLIEYGSVENSVPPVPTLRLKLNSISENLDNLYNSWKLNNGE